MPEGDIVIVGTPWSNPFIGGGGGGGDGGSSHDTSVPNSGPPPGPADEWRMSGRTDCTNLREGFNSVVYAVASTAIGKRLIDSAYHNPTFRVNLSIFQSDDTTTYNSFDQGNKTLTFDPYTFGTGVNPDGTVWSQSGVVIFAHELAHQMLGPNREPEVIKMTNDFARELKRTYPSDNSSTNRISEAGQLQTTTGVTETSFGLHPPCNDE